MKLFRWGKDGGPESTVWGFWLIEWKDVFSVALLKFNGASREVFHTHAFNALSWLLWGKLVETVVVHIGSGDDMIGLATYPEVYKPSLRPIATPRERLHRVDSVGTSWALTFRGPWADYWEEFDDKKRIATTLTYGRKVVDVTSDN